MPPFRRYVVGAPGMMPGRVPGNLPGVPVPRRVNLRVNQRPGLSGLGDMEHIAFPTPVGTPGDPRFPYDESGNVWGGGGIVSPMAGGPAPPPPHPYSNPNTFLTVPLTLGNTAVGSGAVLQANYLRTCLVIQNTSTATSPDTTPTFFVGFNQPPQLLGNTGLAIGLAAGTGIVFDEATPRDTIFVIAGTFSNAGGSTIVI